MKGALQQACGSGVGLGVAWGWSGGGLTWVAQVSARKPLMTLAFWLGVRLSAPCMDGASPANARRVPDVDCVNHWNYCLCRLNARGQSGACYILIRRPFKQWTEPG
jgi:hypothetical protein